MDGNRGSFRAITALLFICLSLKVNGKQFKASINRTRGYTPVVHNSRTDSINLNVMHAFNKRNNNYNINNNQNSINSTKNSTKSVMNSGSQSLVTALDFAPRKSGWGLKFGPNYYSSINAANSRPIANMITPSPTGNHSEVSPTPSYTQSTSSTSSKNLYYYSPTYGKKTHKNSKTNVYHYPGSSTTVTTTTISTSTTPPSTTFHYRSDESSNNPSIQRYGENPQYSQSNYPNSSQPLVYYDEERPYVEEAPPVFNNNSIGRQVLREGVKQFATLMNEPIVSPLDETIFNSLSQNTDLFNSEGGGFNRNGEVQTGTWLGPGIAGLIIGILPLVTIIASFIPAFVSVPVISTSPFSRRSHGSDQEFQLEIFNSIKSGITSLERTECLSQMFCTFAAEGRNSNKNLIENIIYRLIDGTPERWAKWLSVDTLFNAIRSNKCESTYQCMAMSAVK